MPSPTLPLAVGPLPIGIFSLLQIILFALSSDIYHLYSIPFYLYSTVGGNVLLVFVVSRVGASVGVAVTSVLSCLVFILFRTCCGFFSCLALASLPKMFFLLEFGDSVNIEGWGINLDGGSCGYH